jgi:hypothetical protein
VFDCGKATALGSDTGDFVVAVGGDPMLLCCGGAVVCLGESGGVVIGAG